jgi:hypothetical protein
MLIVIVLSVVMLSVVMLSVVVPGKLKLAGPYLGQVLN